MLTCKVIAEPFNDGHGCLNIITMSLQVLIILLILSSSWVHDNHNSFKFYLSSTMFNTQLQCIK